MSLHSQPLIPPSSEEDTAVEVLIGLPIEVIDPADLIPIVEDPMEEGEAMAAAILAEEECPVLALLAADSSLAETPDSTSPPEDTYLPAPGTVSNTSVLADNSTSPTLVPKDGDKVTGALLNGFGVGLTELSPKEDKLVKS